MSGSPSRIHESDTPGWRRVVKRILTPIVVTIAVLYFLLDALVLSIIKPVVGKLARLRVAMRIADWVASLGPYPTLVLFLVPVILLEPAKPIGFYIIGTGHAVTGALVIALAEVLKITLVERLFHMSRDKLMTIRAFAVTYSFVVGWIARLRALPAWQAVVKRVAAIKAAVRRYGRHLRHLVGGS